MRVITKLGDVFSAEINETHKKYIQYIANDLTQLNSDVIRVFKKKYLVNENPNLENIVKGEVEFHAHCVVKFGVKMNLWVKVGNSKNIGSLENIIFRGTKDYGHKLGNEPIRVTNDWYIWKINDAKFTNVQFVTEQVRDANIGLVFNPLGILELIKNHKYPQNYPEFS